MSAEWVFAAFVMALAYAFFAFLVWTSAPESDDEQREARWRLACAIWPLTLAWRALFVGLPFLWRAITGTFRDAFPTVNPRPSADPVLVPDAKRLAGLTGVVEPDVDPEQPTPGRWEQP